MARIDPIATHLFKVEIDGLAVGHFQAVTGISSEFESVTHQEGGMNHSSHVLPGQGSFGEITLKRGFGGDGSLYAWLDLVAGLGASARTVRRTLSIVIVGDDGHSELGRYVVEGAWPKKWSFDELSGSSDQLAIESLELAHEGLEFVKGRGGALDALRAVGQRAAAAARAARAVGEGVRAIRSAAAAAADAARAGGSGVGGTLSAAGAAANSVDRALGLVSSGAGSASAGLAAASAAPSALAAAWADAGAAATGDATAAVEGALAAGVPAEVASRVSAGSSAAAEGVTAARGFARAPTAGDAAAAADRPWSDGVVPRQQAAGFGEAGLPRR